MDILSIKSQNLLLPVPPTHDKPVLTT